MKRPIASLALATLAALGTSHCAPQAQPTESFVLQLASFPPTLDPALQYDVVSIAVVGRVFTGLLSLDPETLEPRPELAESYEVLEGGRRLRFHLRRGARFHDGRPVVAEDFRFAFERLLRHNPPAPAAWILHPLRGAAAFARGEVESLEGVVVEDDHTLTLELEAPFAPFLQHLAMPNAAAVEREAIEAGGLPIGTGPYRVESADPQTGSISLRAFDGYALARPTLERIEIVVIPDPGRALERYWQGELDMLTLLPPSLQNALRGELGPALHQWPTLSLFYLVASPTRLPPSLLPRRALAQLIDRHAICDELLTGRCQAAAGILPPGILGHDPLLPSLRFDPEAGAELLARSGHRAGTGIPELQLWVQERTEHEAVAYGLVEQLARAGLRVTVHPVPWAELLQAAATGEFDLLLIPWTADYPDPDNFLFPLLHSSQRGAKNYAGYHNPEFDRLIETARRAITPSKRVELYRAAERLALADAPFVPLYFPNDAVAVRPGWGELTLHPMGWQQIPLERLSWREP